MSDKGGPGFHHIALSVFDFDKTVEFYASGLDFKVRYGWGEAPHRAAMIDIGSGDYLEVFEGGKSPLETAQGVLLHFALRTSNTDAAFAKAIAAGAVVEMEPKDVPIKGTPEIVVRIAFVKGPDNEIIEFFQNEYL
jgi:glyoxylase I family protein